jgi:hypothetical protein
MLTFLIIIHRSYWILVHIDLVDHNNATRNIYYKFYNFVYHEDIKKYGQWFHLLAITKKNIIVFLRPIRKSLYIVQCSRVSRMMSVNLIFSCRIKVHDIYQCII